MAKRVSLFGVLAIAILLFFIWDNPHGTAHTISAFLDGVGHVASQAWSKLGEFVKSLANG